MEMETRTVKSEEDQHPRTDPSHEETENEKPERSRDSTIHTAHQLLVDTIFQVLKLLTDHHFNKLTIWNYKLPLILKNFISIWLFGGFISYQSFKEYCWYDILLSVSSNTLGRCVSTSLSR